MHLAIEWLVQDVKSSKTTFINRTQQCFAVRSGADSILDLARSTFCRVTEQVHELVDKYKTEYGMDGLKVDPNLLIAIGSFLLCTMQPLVLK